VASPSGRKAPAWRWMSRAEQLQPRIDELHRKHGHDRQRLNEELLAFYQGEGLSPAAGCLAVLRQVMVSLLYACAVYLPFLRPPLQQGLDDPIAHTVVVQRTRGPRAGERSS
jgi:60Kd inner membrane protein